MTEFIAPIRDSDDLSLVKVELAFVDAAMAKGLLRHNVHNRHLDHRAVARLDEIRLRGEWGLSDSMVCVAKDGTLLNGQHRLEMIAKSKATQGLPLVIAWNVPFTAQTVMDMPKRRNVSDTLTLNGYANANALAASLVWIGRYRATRSLREPSTGKLTPQRALVMLEDEVAYDDLAQCVTHAKACNDRWRYRPGLGSALRYLFYEVESMEESITFFDRLTTGSDLAVGSPILQLRNQLIRDQQAIRKLPGWHIGALTIKAWNAWIMGASLGVLKFTPGGSSPERFPVIVGNAITDDVEDDL